MIEWIAHVGQIALTDPENRLLAQTESVAGTVTRSWAYSYDPADRLTQALASPGGTYAYTLDAADNLTGQQTPTGTASSTVNTLNQLVQRSGQPLTHDAAGNRTDDGTRTYAWDAQQRLVRIGHTGTGRSTSFRYDAFGRRTAVIETDDTGSTETRYRWCGERVCQARDGADTVTRRYYDEGELAVSATGDVAAFYAEDHLGSIRDLRMGDGQVQAAYDYAPYGNPTRSDETGGVRADYRYAGLVHHAQSNLYLAHYRAYSADDGRWMSRDPIGEAGGVNLYAYVEGNPVNWVDPLGLVNTDPNSPFGPWGVEGGRVGGGAGSATPLPRLPASPGLKAPSLPAPTTRPPYPGSNSTQCPPEYEWRGKKCAKPGSKEGNYYNPTTKEILRPDLSHELPIGPHWDYRDAAGKWYRLFPDGTVEAK